jgi:hypothetical protein
MNRKYIFWGMFAIAATSLSFAEPPPPMVERHIFTPENTTDQKTDAVPGPVDGSDLLKDIHFTGVMNTSKGKQAIIVESAKNDKSKKKHVVKEGDLIKGMTLKEIGPNYVLIETKENTIKLNLYKGTKTRPVAPPTPALPEPPATSPDLMNQPKPGSPVAAPQQMPSPGRGKGDVRSALPMPVTDGGAGISGGPNRGMPGPQVPDSGNNPLPVPNAPEHNSPAGNASGQAINPFVMPSNQ